MLAKQPPNKLDHHERTYGGLKVHIRKTAVAVWVRAQCGTVARTHKTLHKKKREGTGFFPLTQKGHLIGYICGVGPAETVSGVQSTELVTTGLVGRSASTELGDPHGERGP